MAIADSGPSEAAVERVLPLLQSANNEHRRQAEAQLEAWSTNPQLLQVLMTCAHRSPQLGSRQLAATVLSWKLPKLWKGLGAEDQRATEAAMLRCFSGCSEAPVLRQLGEACNALCQSFALDRDCVWQDLILLIGNLLNGESVLHRRAALDLLVALVESMGLRLRPCYPDISSTLAARIRDADADVRIAALGVGAALAAAWASSSEAPSAEWGATANATLEAAARALSGDAASGGAKVLVAALRALSRLVPLLRDQQLATASVELACRVVGGGASVRAAESCCVQALQLLRTLARKASDLLGDDAMGAAVQAACKAAKDANPSVDDLNEVSPVALAARDCLRSLARARPQRALPLVYEVAQASSQSPDAMDRAAAVHAVVFALCGAREAPKGWALPLARALGDAAVWVRQAGCEAAPLLADALRPADDTTEGLLQLLVALAERLPSESQPELAKKLADGCAALFRELTTDEAAPILRQTVPPLLQALPVSLSAAERLQAEAKASRSSDDAEAAASAVGAVVAMASALGAAATAAADTFADYAVATAQVLVPLLRAGLSGTSTAVNASVFAACLDAAGSVVGSAWGEAEFRAAREELAVVAQSVLSNAQAPTEVRASAHRFFARVSLACFEEFAPHLPMVVPVAIGALNASDGSEAGIGRSRRAVRSGTQEEREAAAEALGSYAAAVGGAAFAGQLPQALPALCAQASHSSPGMRAAVAGALAQIGRGFDELGQKLGAGDRPAAEALARAVIQAMVQLLDNSDASDGASAFRSALLAREDLLECQGLLTLAGAEAASALQAAGGGVAADDVESEDVSDLGEEDEDA